MVERTVDWEIIGVAVLVTFVIVGGIYSLGMGLNNYKLNKLSSDIKDLEVQQRSQSLGFEMARSFDTQGCSAMKTWIRTSTPEISSLRKKVAAYESSSKFDSPEYQLLKKRYTNLVIQNYLEVRTLESKCGKQVLDIVYFYSKDKCPACEDQGTVLTYFRRKYPSRLIVFPLDTDLGMRNIEFLEETYNITDYPAVVVNGQVYHSFQSKNKLGSVIDRELESMNSTKALEVN
ncbi:MAG: hypothetical protein ABEJ99_01300 [Candidatus Nanohaloarchaea archaeon]